MELRDLDYFAMLAEHGHVGRAAEALGLGQPALSMSLRRLEKSLQAKLVKRTPKGVELTAVGAALLAHVRRLRLAHDDMAREVADLSEGRAGHLRIGISPGFTESVTGAACSVLVKEAPKVTLKIDVTTPDELLSALRNGTLDLTASVIPLTRAEDVVHEHLLDDEFIVYASVNHRLAGRKRVTLADLAQERWTTLAASGFSWQAVRRAFEERGLPPPALAMESNSMSIRLQAVASSDLLGFSSRPVLRRADPRLRLTELPVKELKWVRQNGVSYRKDGYLSPSGRRLVEILKSKTREIADEYT